MNKLLLILYLSVIPFIGFCQDNQSAAIAETMSNTFNFYGDKLTGTCFMVLKDGKQFFVTAAHLFQSTDKSGDSVSVQMVVENKLQSFEAKVYFHTNRKIDIAIFTLPEKITQDLTIPDEQSQYKDELKKWFVGEGISEDSMFYTAGLDVFFFGFPLGNLGTEFLGVKFPLVKKAVISGWVKHDGVGLMLLDGHNNLGFSGGPITTYNVVNKKMCLIGVISGYLPEPLDVKRKKDKLSANANSGIIICYEVRYIEEIFAINKNLSAKF